jgi:glutamate-5-semialdehyde dehydrogenase
MSEATEKGALAKAASFAVSALAADRKNAALRRIAAALAEKSDEIAAANAIDMERGRQEGMSPGILDRLMLNPGRISGIAEGVLQVAELADPVGETLSETARPNGIIVKKVRVPLGVVGIIYEARPNVTADAAALALKAGNAVILRGSRSAINSNRAIVAAMRLALSQSDIPPDAIQLLEGEDRETARELMRLDKYLDVLIPRGGAGLIRNVLEHSTVPVIETGTGNCHIFLDESADPDMAVSIVVNAKTQRPSVCNAAEKLLVHANWPRENLEMVLEALHKAGVELRCDEAVRIKFPGDGRLRELPAEDYEVEYIDLIMGVKTVAGVDEAIEHINRYGSRHTDAIITADRSNAGRFLRMVDSASVNHNASTRFTDGFVFGFGAEIGISTQKLHARGPMALPELTTYKYLVFGDGQIRE